ncbi:MAG: cyclic nucleotide-binding domain-containing protein [Gammaproteobacteria bacterium]|nr:cyclic nucleotide-binding domain-containing protein [Sideroxydans sp.]MBU3903744.1 cyclic nucleotide-binding domain-containing protein [Gammaproteobacteria bacterium]MBU4046113.1 cyclic nucleotide-binding domain-containing protein [Gammaproteobacteria bacterium]MBU4150475.1 cyclic nucleotide-binding domain-containing protein [Gammaproteobacteria bacterium]
MSAVADHRIVRNSTVGTELTEDKAKLLAGKLGVRQLKDGELLVKEGEADQTLFILATGKLAVTSKDAQGVEQAVYTMKEGECAGTRAFVEQSPRKATLRSMGDSTVYTLTPADFETLLEENPRLAFKVMRALFRVTHANLSRMNQETRELANYISKTQGRY